MKYQAIFVDENYFELGRKVFNGTEKFITFKTGTFNVRIEDFIFRNNDYTYFVYGFEDNSKDVLPLKSKKLKEKIESGDLKLLVGENIIMQLARAAIAEVKTNWIFIIIALAGGIGIGYGIGSSLGSHVINNYLNSTATTIHVTPIPTHTYTP